MPPGSRQRAVSLAARETVRDLRGTAQALRRHWTAPDVAELPPPPYPLWLAGHRAGRAELAAQTARADEIADGLDVLVLVLPGGGDLAATTASLEAQSSPRWRALVWSTVDTADERITALGDADAAATAAAWLAQHGRALTILLRAGDRLAPEGIFEVALAVHRAPG